MWEYKSKNTLMIDRKIYQYKRGSCRNQISIFKNTFFASCKFGIDTLLYLAYLFLLKTLLTCIVLKVHLSSATVTEWGGDYKPVISKNYGLEEC